MKPKENFKPYATIYQPTKQGIAHCCINHAHNHRTYGAMFIIECKRMAKGMPIYDISNTTKILGLNPDNMIQSGELLETIEYDIAQHKVIQSRGQQNQPTKHNKKILQAIEVNKNQILQIH